MMLLTTILVVLVGLGEGNYIKKRHPFLPDPSHIFGVPPRWDWHPNRMWRLDGNVDDVISREWPNFPERRHNFGNDWGGREWLPRSVPFEHRWPFVPPPDIPWEAVDVTGIDQTFTSNDHPWWKGPNICVEKKETVQQQKEDGNSNDIHEIQHSSDCKETETSYVCEVSVYNKNGNKTVYTKHECCHGFKRRYDGLPGCMEIDLKDLVQTLNSLVLTRFLEIATDIGFEKHLREMNYTIFAPNNEAFENYNNLITDAHGTTITTLEDMKSLQEGHAVAGFYKSGDFIDEEVMMTANRKSGIRVNFYYMPEKIITANCVRVIGINSYARNGIVHIVDKVLPQPTRTVADIISSDPQFSILKALLSQAGLVQTLRDPAGNFTLFAPTDTVFNADESKMKLLERLVVGGNCVTTILKNHLLPNVICTPALSGQARTVNMLGHFMILSRNEDDKLFINGIQIVARDIMATNGVVHIIDGILLPNEAVTITEALAESGMNELLDLVVSAGLENELNSMSNFTFFAPTTKALQRMSPFLKEELSNDKEKLRETILYHFVEPTVEECDFRNDLTLNSLDNNNTVRINQYGEFPGSPTHTTAQCTRVITSDKKVCGGIMHLVERILLPPKENIMDVLEGMDEFSTLRTLLNETGLGEMLRENDGPFTLFAPTNNAFRAYSEASSSDVLKNKLEAEKFLKVHILEESLCCAGVHHSVFGSHQARTIGGSYVPIHRRQTGWIWYGPARIVHCDMTARNGVVHIVDKVLYHTPRGTFNVPFHDDFFGSPFP